MSGQHISRYGLDHHGIHGLREAHWNLSVPALYEIAIQRNEGIVAEGGPLVVRTGVHTGRSPNDKFFVREPSSADRIWWGKVNKAITQQQADGLYARMLEYVKGRDLFVQDCFAGADPVYQIPIRIITQLAWHGVFAKSLFIRPTPEQLAVHNPQFTVISLPGFKADPKIDGTASETAIVVDLGKNYILVAGSAYAGEIKKSIFTILNYFMPLRGVFPMHCSANIGPDGDTAIFFGLSGTGKTSLSADPGRALIGDDEHGWSNQGVFNFEGGCYAKVIRLSPTAEPEIYATTRRFGTILENVVYDEETRALQLDDETITENTRGGYPLNFNPMTVEPSVGGHPKNIVFLTADAFGVMPPIARLNTEQAMYQFLSGYTAKLAGTERGITEPQATFSTCFGAPFLPLPPITYARMLGEKVQKHKAAVWMVNTGWSGGPYGVGSRVKIAYTRAMVRAAIEGKLDEIPTEPDPVFCVQVPAAVPGIPTEILKPRNTWADGAAYDEQARQLAAMFAQNMEQFASQVSDEIRRAGPCVG